jgi:hypothetical protein
MKGTALVASALVLSLSTRAASAPSGPAPPDMVAYRIQAQDTLESIVRRYLMSGDDVALLERINHISNPHRLRIGAILLAPRSRLGTEAIPLRVDSFSGSVIAGSAGAQAPVKVGDLVRAGDVIATGPNSFVTLVFADGTLMTLPSLTRAKVELLHRVLLNDVIERRISIELGRGSYRVTPLRVPRDRFEVRTPMAVAAVRGTEFRVSYEEQAARSVLEVLEGRVVEEGDARVHDEEIPSGDADVRRAGQSETIEPLPGAPNLQRPGRVQDGANVEFTVDSPRQGYLYRVQLAKDAGFTNLFAETIVTQAAAQFSNVANGAFFVRVTAVNGDGVEGLPRMYRFERLYTSPSGGAAPSSGEPKVKAN